jgi:CheY-like chemotaxis protein
METFEILMAEDNEADVRMTEVALRRAEVPARLSSVEDGLEAMRFLRREGLYADAPRPDLMLLDLRMPRKDGHEVLEEMKADERLRRIPVVVFTSSRAPRDVALAYALHANCYVVKPMAFDAYMGLMRTIAGYWLQTAVLPPACSTDEDDLGPSSVHA